MEMRRAAARVVAPSPPQGREVHVWSIDLRAAEAGPSQWLDEAELGRARRFVYADDATRYLRAHLALRAILGAYLRREPAELRFAQSEHGKPSLVLDGGGWPFNLSHSKDIAVVAIASGGEVGVDVEAVGDDLPSADLAAAVLCAEESEDLARMPTAAQAACFVACWTRKEACLKAVGLGLSLEPRTLHVGLEPRRLELRIAGHELVVDALAVPRGYRAAVAAVGGLGPLRDFVFEA